MCTIGYIEPDDAVRAATAHHLEQAGHTVPACPSGELP
jgi:CheY-like chemotaxis protein